MFTVYSKKYRNAVIIALCLLLNSNALFSQEYLYEYKRILVDPSLTDNHIYDVTNDKYGMIWLATGVGLFRFDGYATEKIEYHTDKFNQHDETINKIAYFGDTLFIGDNEGIHAINCFSHEPIEIDKTPHNKILGLTADLETGVWWLNEKGILSNYHHNKKQSIQLANNIQILKTELLSSNHQLFVATNLALGHQVFLIDEVNLKTKKWESSNAYNNFVRNIRADVNGNINFLATPQPFCWDKIKKDFYTINNTDENTYDLINTKNGRFSIIGGNQIFHYENNDAIFPKIRINLGTDKPEGLYKLFDFNGCIYVACSNGLIVVKSKKKLFQTIFSTYNAKENTYWVPRGMAEDGENIYLATYNNIFRYNRTTNSTVVINHNNFANRAMLKDADTLWIGTEGGGIMKFLLSGKTNGKFLTDRIKYFTTIFCLSKLDEHRIIAGGLNTFFIFDKRTKKALDVNVKIKGRNISENQVTQILVIDTNRILIATGIGVYLIDEKGNVLNDYTKKIKDINSLKVNAIVINNDNSIWLGTEGGILHIDINGNIISHLTRNEGLAGNLIVSMLPDNNGHLWAASYTGLSCIDTKTSIITNFYKEDGIPDNEFNRASFMISRDGSIVLGSVNGFIRFFPNIFELNENENLDIKISKIESGNQQKKISSWLMYNENKTPIRLGKEIKFIKLALFINPINVFRNTQYEYKIEDIHTDWISLGNTPVLHIDNFKPGKYNLIIRAITGSGSRYIITKTYPIVVEEYFYNTNWFFITMYSVILLLIVLYLFTIIQRNKKIIEIRQLIAQDLHDEVGGYLTGISMNLELLQKKKDIDPKYFIAIQALGQNALKALKDSLWSLNSQSDTAEELWDWVKNVASETFENLDIDFQFQQIEGLEKIKLSMLEKSYLIYIIKECITNSIKYGDRKLVKFEWKKLNGLHTIFITNKIGNQEPVIKSGNGLHNIQNRMKTIKGSSDVENLNDNFIVALHLNFLT